MGKLSRKFFHSVFLFYLICLHVSFSAERASFWSVRKQILNEEQGLLLGAKLPLSKEEQEVNDRLMSYKLAELNIELENSMLFGEGQHFFLMKQRIEKSEVFRMISKMPKAAILHIHDNAMASYDFIYNLTYSENLYGCHVKEKLYFHFFDEEVNSFCQWRLVKDLRKNKKFERLITLQLSLFRQKPYKAYPGIKSVLKQLEQTSVAVHGLIFCKSTFSKYLYNSFLDMYNRGILYAEIRVRTLKLYDSGISSKEKSGDVVTVYRNVLADFREEYPDFLGVKLIISADRHATKEMIEYNVNFVTKLKNIFPELVLGMDVSGHEDGKAKLVNMVPQLLKAKNRFKYFLHSSDTNLYDSILLHSKRISDAFGLMSHPKLLDRIKSQRIAIEVNPISSQVLNLIYDLKNHPGAYLIFMGYAVVISNDYPGFWNASGLNHDWYMTFMAMAPRYANLKFLKQLALNNIIHSGLNKEGKLELLDLWTDKWESFIKEMRGNHTKM